MDLKLNCLIREGINIDPLFFIIPPLLILGIRLLLGVCFKFDLLKLKSKKFVPLVIFAVASGIGLFFLATYFSENLSSIYLFQNFASLFEQNYIDIIRYNAQFIAIIILIGLFEVGLGSGFGIAVKVGSKRKIPKTALEQKNISKTSTPARPTTYKLDSSAPTSLNNQAENHLNAASVAEDQSLR
jgi:hypothetical protein